MFYIDSQRKMIAGDVLGCFADYGLIQTVATDHRAILKKQVYDTPKGKLTLTFIDDEEGVFSLVYQPADKTKPIGFRLCKRPSDAIDFMVDCLFS